MFEAEEEVVVAVLRGKAVWENQKRSDDKRGAGGAERRRKELREVPADDDGAGRSVCSRGKMLFTQGKGEGKGWRGRMRREDQQRGKGGRRVGWGEEEVNGEVG